MSITVPFRTMTRNDDGTYTVGAPPTIANDTVTASTFAVLKVDGGTVTQVAVEPVGTTNGTLTVRKAADAGGVRRWAPGRYVLAVRGGANGVKTSTGLPVSADLAISLVIPNKDLSVAENQPPGGIPADLVARLNQVRSLLWNPIDWNNVGGQWVPAGAAGITPAFTAVDTAFPHTEVAAIATFEVASGTRALFDSSAGQIPLPSDFLLDGANPVENDPGRFHVRNVPSFGAAAAGLTTLDGFSTTGLILQPLNGPVQATTINANSVLVFELPSGGNPRRMVDVAAAVQANAPGTAEYLTQPPALNQTVNGTALTTAIGLQPGVAVPVAPGAIIYTPPLKERARYLVVITDRVLDATNAPLRRNTLSSILWGFPADVSLVDEGGVSLVPGLSNGDAQALQAMRVALNPVLDNLGAISGDDTLSRDNVVMAYTISTQSVTGTSIRLSAAPYDPNADGNPTDSVAFTSPSADVFNISEAGFPDAAMPALFPHVKTFLKGTTISLDAINPANGALNPDTSAWTPVQLPVLVAVPTVPDTCTTDAPCFRNVVVFHHGIFGSRLQMLGTAEALAARGFVVVATDAPYHGARAFCAQDSDCSADGTATGANGVCTSDPNKAGQGDAVPPGTCTAGSTLRPSSNLSTVASGNYFISANFFRIRDAIRQDLFDQAALVLSLSRPPAPFPQPAGNALVTALRGQGIVINPTQVAYEGMSLGAIIGTSVLATNPRFARGVLDVPGGTLTDIFMNAPAFSDEVNQLLLSLGVDRSQIATNPAMAARYLQINILAKWILDPADPLNYAPYAGGGLVSPLTAALGPAAHAERDLFGQLVKCDPVVPNATTVVNGVPLPYGDELLALAGIRADGTTLYSAEDSDTNPNGCVSHGVLLDTFGGLADPPVPVIGAQVRDDAAQFLFDLTYPPSDVTLSAP
ncbi:MAG: hypothetical protein QM767_20565 [Anaeromyxobacter sp.]